MLIVDRNCCGRSWLKLLYSSTWIDLYRNGQELSAAAFDSLCCPIAYEFILEHTEFEVVLAHIVDIELPLLLLSTLRYWSMEHFTMESFLGAF